MSDREAIMVLRVWFTALAHQYMNPAEIAALDRAIIALEHKAETAQ